MYLRLLRFLRCPDCNGPLQLEAAEPAGTDEDGEVSRGLLRCSESHWFPIIRGIPRLLPDALMEHRDELEGLINDATSPEVQELRTRLSSAEAAARQYDRRTRENFTREWEHHQLGDPTWGIELDDRVQRYFLDAIRIPRAELAGKVMLDAGCGNGSQSVAYTEFGLEVIAIDISSGVERGEAFRHTYSRAQADKVHFVQADLQAPPVAPGSIDLIHSAGVLHHTPDTKRTFDTLCGLLRDEGTFYVWLYKYEPIVTPVVNSIRKASTRLSAARFSLMAKVLAEPFRLFCATVNTLGIRSYPPLSRREAALALMDIFGAPYAHYHTPEEVAQWFEAEGFGEPWGCNETRRGFGMCGRRKAADQRAPVPEVKEEVGQAV